MVVFHNYIRKNKFFCLVYHFVFYSFSLFPFSSKFLNFLKFVLIVTKPSLLCFYPKPQRF
jgi:hypothetical protein